MIEFGLSISSEEHFEKLPIKKAAKFDFLEFSGSLLDSEPACRKLESLQKAGVALVVRDFLNPSLVRLVPTEKFQVHLEFDRQLHLRCSAAASLGADMAGAAFDVEKALEDSEYAASLIKLLKSSFATFHNNGLEILLPGRIPASPGSEDITKVISFSSQLLNPHLITAIEFHPHEPGAFDELEKHFNILRFHRNYWRVFFEPEHGNYLSSSLLKKFLDAADMKSVVSSRVAIAPGNQMPDDDTLQELLKLIGEIENEY